MICKIYASSSSNLVDNLEYKSVKDNLIKYKCLSCNKNYSNKIVEELKKRFKNTFKFFNNGISKVILLLRKGVYLYEYMDDWEKFDKTTLPEKEEFYSDLNMEDIADADYMHAERVSKDFEIKSLGEYHDFYLKSDTLHLADVLKKIQKKVFENLSFRSCKISFSSWISMTTSFKKD